MSKYVKIEKDNTFIRDTSSSAILNNSVGAYQLYKARRQKQNKQNDEVDQLKQEIQELKQLIIQMTQRDK